MTSDRRVSVHDVMPCDGVAATMIARRSRSVDSGLVTDVDLPQRALTAVTVCDAAVEPSSSAPMTSRVVGSWDSGLVDVYGTQDCVHEHSDRLSVCDCSTVASPPVSPTTQHQDDVACRTYNSQSSPVSAAVTNNGQSWLLRLFESKLFDMSIAIQYLFNSKESGVQTYIGESSDTCTCFT